MTVVKDQPLSHKNHGWEIFTDNVIRMLGKRKEKMVFILWGSYARSKKALIESKNHLILEAVHPSPLSAYRGFFGCGHFKKCNDFLQETNQERIIW